MFFLPVLLFAQKSTFYLYPEIEGNAPVDVQLEWKDSWLTESPSETYNHDLARIACVLADSSYDNIRNNPTGNCAARNFRALGVRNSCMEFHYDIDYTAPVVGNNQAACSFAYKVIEGHTLVFVVIRGTPSDAHEWISNISISDAGGQVQKIHEGFYFTEREIHRSLIYYLLKNKIDPDTVSFLISGHSRGAAVANLLGESLADDGYFNEKRIYVYTFASPNVSTEEKTRDNRYSFIWNIVNPEDVVPTVPPCRGGWKYSKFGNTLTLFSSWSVDPAVFEENYMPRFNKLFAKFFNRDYCPFRIGTFISTYLARSLTDFYSTVDGFYSSRFDVSKRIEEIFWKIFPDKNAEKKEEESSSGLMSRFATMINYETNGLLDYSAFAFADMHSCKTYLTFLLAFDESEAYSDLGSTQIVLHGNYECAVFDKDGNIKARVLDGVLQFKSLDVPVAAMYIPGQTVIALPSNEDFTLVIYKESLLPTAVSMIIENYNSAGYLIESSREKTILPHMGKVYVYRLGKINAGNLDVKPVKFYGKRCSQIVAKGDLKPGSVFRIQPEITFNSDMNFAFGLRAGTRNIYGGLLVGHSVTDLGKAADISLGIGHQEILYGAIVFDSELYEKNVISIDKPEEGTSRFNVVPSLRLSLAYKPFRRFQFFASGIFDLQIKGFNEGAFTSSSRDTALGKISMTDSLSLVPSLCIGLRF